MYVCYCSLKILNGLYFTVLFSVIQAGLRLDNFAVPSVTCQANVTLLSGSCYALVSPSGEI